MAKQKITFNPQVLDLVLYSGDGNGFRMTVTGISGTPIPLTGTMRAQIRATRDSPDPPDAVFDIDMSEGANGVVNLQVPANQTQNLVSDTDSYSGVWDLEWTPTDEEPLTICQGKVECLRDVSH